MKLPESSATRFSTETPTVGRSKVSSTSATKGIMRGFLPYRCETNSHITDPHLHEDIPLYIPSIYLFVIHPPLQPAASNFPKLPVPTCHRPPSNPFNDSSCPGAGPRHTETMFTNSLEVQLVPMPFTFRRQSYLLAVRWVAATWFVVSLHHSNRIRMQTAYETAVCAVYVSLPRHATLAGAIPMGDHAASNPVPNLPL